MKKHLIFLLSFMVLFATSCKKINTGYVNNQFIIENKTDADINLKFIRNGVKIFDNEVTSDKNKQFSIKKGDKTVIFFSNGFPSVYPEIYDTAYIYYKNYIFIDTHDKYSEKNLLNSSSYTAINWIENQSPIV